MPRGLLIDLRDGGPAMQITAGLRCPSFCGLVNGNGTVYNAPGYVPGSALVYAPHQTTVIYPNGTSLIPAVGCLQAAAQNGGSMQISSWWSVPGFSNILWPGTMWQILPASQSGNRGLLISDSTDFTAITDASVVGQCVWRGRVTIAGRWTLPDTGWNRATYVVFAKWSADGIVVEYDGNQIIVTGESEDLGYDATATLDIVIFAAGVPPTPGRGLNFFNPAGACTFSTTRRPFVYSNAYYRPSAAWTDIGDRFVMLGRYGAMSAVSFGWCYAKYLGLVRSGNALRVGKGRTAQYWTDKYSVPMNVIAGINVLLLESMY
ncbi:DUF6453 family protein [Atlantibacter hermannii]|uniref:DUF6453 family protein n=1 Tax=Atlantibacter hermannii TaxID=565 RepID=UPI002FF876B2